MQQQSSAPAHPSTRELRGIALYEEHAEEIRFEQGVWLVPSQNDATSVYEVVIGRRGESCECVGFEHRGESCKHIHAAAIARAKTTPCSCCGERVPWRFVTTVEEDHDLLTWFPGDRNLLRLHPRWTLGSVRARLAGASFAAPLLLSVYGLERCLHGRNLLHQLHSPECVC